MAVVRFVQPVWFVQQPPRKARLSSWRLDGLTRECRRLLNSQRPAPHHARGQTWLLLAHRAKTARQQAWARRCPLSIERAKGPDCPIDRCRNGRQGAVSKTAPDAQNRGETSRRPTRRPSAGRGQKRLPAPSPNGAAADDPSVARLSENRGRPPGLRDSWDGKRFHRC